MWIVWTDPHLQLDSITLDGNTVHLNIIYPWKQQYPLPQTRYSRGTVENSQYLQVRKKMFYTFL